MPSLNKKRAAFFFIKFTFGSSCVVKMTSIKAKGRFLKMIKILKYMRMKEWLLVLCSTVFIVG